MPSGREAEYDAWVFFTCLAKITGTLAGLYLACFHVEHPLLIAVVLGITPIWLEVAATWATGTEPSLETRSAWRYTDALIDALSFVLIPAIWLGGRYPVLGPSAVLFAFCGLYRLARFLKRGLVDNQYFIGLPVTYTGYAWLPCAYSIERHSPLSAQILLSLLSFLMVWTRLKIKRTQTRNDTTPVN